MTTHAAITISVSINAPPETVYAYASDPTHLPSWAPGFARSVRRDGHRWIVETREGSVLVEFAGPNDFGVLDHRVCNDDGLDFESRMRVVSNGDGSEVLFTLFRSDGMAADAFEADRLAVESDLHRLKEVLEGRSQQMGER